MHVQQLDAVQLQLLRDALLTDEAPLYDLPVRRPAYLDHVADAGDLKLPSGAELADVAKGLLSDPNISSKRWIYEQYDTQVQTSTIQRPGGSAAVLRLNPSGKKIALTTDCNGLLCYLDPREGAKLAVSEAARNLVCAGARPLGLTNCLNFGNPNKPEIFWQFSEVIAGMGEACRALEIPVTGGNVSFYNENPGGAVHPTPVIGMVGLIQGADAPLSPFFAQSGLELWLIGPDPVTLGGSRYAQLHGEGPVGPCPRIDLEIERAVQGLLLDLNGQGLLRSAHDISEGGLWVAAAEGAIGGETGMELDAPPEGCGAALWLFSECPSRILVGAEAHRGAAIGAEARRRGVHARRVGRTGGAALGFGDLFSIALEEARRIYYNEP
ncbi:hypothetical protein IIC65_03055 [Candidatus Sumerlaeota bacterium]|nr:hypothetical protein [Candidatus Sumerlaeota bacterium]